jgi:hypothetical protein
LHLCWRSRLSYELDDDDVFFPVFGLFNNAVFFSHNSEVVSTISAKIKFRVDSQVQKKRIPSALQRGIYVTTDRLFENFPLLPGEDNTVVVQ